MMGVIRATAAALALALRVAVGLVLLLALIPLSVQAGAPPAAADVRLGDVNCAGSPEVVEVRNFGNEGQDLTGWQLQSDGDAPYDLTPSGTIAAGGSIYIESGPAAQGTFRWSQSEVLRNNDATDYVRLVDSTGATRGQTACAAGGAAATPTPTPVALAATTTPTPAPGGVPDGGGPPGRPEGVLTPALMIYLGGSLIGVVLGLAFASLGISFTAGRIRSRRAHPRTSGPAPQPPAAVAEVRFPATVHTGLEERATAQPLLLALIVALLGAILVLLLAQSQESSKRP